MSRETFFGPYEDPFFRDPKSYGPVKEDMLDFEFFLRLPFSDLKFGIWEEDEIYKAFEAFPTWRLHSVKQLSFLAYIGPSPETQYLMEFNHARDEHTFLVAKLMENVLKNNNAPQDLVKKGIAGGMIHDQATPALGDATKKIDPINLNEEDFWYEVMEKKGWDYLKSINATREEIDDMVHNKELLGKVLDITDRISYVMLDLSHIIHTDNLESVLENANYYGYRAEMAEVLQKETQVGDIYKDISIDWRTEEVCFTNPQRLGRFLELRALLNKSLYLNPISQARDFMVVQAIKPYYSIDESDKTKLTPNRLRRMSDYQLIAYLEEKEEFKENVYGVVGKRHDVYHSLVRWYPQYRRKFDTQKEMEAERSRIESNNHLILNGSFESKGFNPATDYKVLTAEREIIPFKEFDPDASRKIQEIADSTKGNLLFWQKRKRRIEPDYYMKGLNDIPPVF